MDDTEVNYFNINKMGEIVMSFFEKIKNYFLNEGVPKERELASEEHTVSKTSMDTVDANNIENSTGLKSIDGQYITPFSINDRR